MLPHTWISVKNFVKICFVISIVVVVFNGKDNYYEWCINTKKTFIYNDLQRDVCEGEGDNPLTKPTSKKKLSLWDSKNNKGYALIVACANEEVNHHIAPIANAFHALKKMEILYELHSQLEVVQLMIKLFNLELKDDDSLVLASQMLFVKKFWH